MQVKTALWGMVEVRYWRDMQGREGLFVPAAPSIELWVTSKKGPPRFLVPADLATSGTWDQTLRDVLRADIEDDKMAYVPPAKVAAKAGK